MVEPTPPASAPEANDEAVETASPRQRRVRSFVLRAGRMGSGQARALASLGPRLVLPYRANVLDPATTFGRVAPLVVEIGFGMGHATAAFAAAHRDTDVLGLEVHAPGVGSLLKACGEMGLENVRVVQHDAVEVLEHMIAPESLAGIHCFFPDPWHKKRHHKRRLIQSGFARVLADRLHKGGYLHLATDWQDYALRMREVLDATPGLVNAAGAEGFVERPASRPMTKFEQRGLRLGHGVWDLMYRRAG
jgi:tRNA (guanine-N7-)-methyltransferase